MNGKTKSFFEDTLILIVIIAIIYGIYTYFFATNEIINNSVESQSVVVNPANIENENITFPDINEDQTAEILNEEVIIEQINQETKATEEEFLAQEPENTKNINTEVIQEKSLAPVTIEDFYKSTEEKIYSNISKNVDKDLINNLSDVNIRITILKNGEFEQLKYMSGNRQYYNLIKSSILETFPVKINDNLKYKFPRYFRMKVKP